MKEMDWRDDFDENRIEKKNFEELDENFKRDKNTDDARQRWIRTTNEKEEKNDI